MLESLRKGTGSIIAKAFIGVLILSFAAWGIGDIFLGYGSAVIASVGDRDISRDDFDREIRLQTQQLGATLQRNLSAVDLERFQINRRALDLLINQAVLDNAADGFDLVVSDTHLRNTIADVSSFHNSAGRFDRQLFETYLNRNSLTEEDFIRQSRQNLIRRQYSAPLSNAVPPPAILTETLLRQRQQRRVIDYVLIPNDRAGEVSEADEATLQAFYDANQELFMAPEYRRFTLLHIDPSDLIPVGDISEEDLLARYERDRNRYTTPETRNISQIVFADRQSAEAAYDRIKAGADFFTIATERGLTADEITLGRLTRDAIAVPEIAAAAFALNSNNVGGPVETPFGFALISVGNITLEYTTPFALAQSDLLYILRYERGLNHIDETYKYIEDQRASGTRLDEIAAELEIPLKSISLVTENGFSPDFGDGDGTMPSVLADYDEATLGAVLNAAFSHQASDDIAPIEFANDALVWIDIDDIQPRGPMPFIAIHDRVAVAREKKLERENALDYVRSKVETAATINLNTISDDFADLLPQKTEPLLRIDDRKTPFTRQAMARLFALAADEPIYGLTRSTDAVFIAIVSQIDNTTPNPDDSDWESTHNTIATAISREMALHFVTALKNRYPISINDTAWRQLNGNSAAAP